MRTLLDLFLLALRVKTLHKMSFFKSIIGSSSSSQKKKPEVPVNQAPTSQPQLRAVGIARIERQIEQSDQRNKSIINNAFDDINILMSQAKEMVQLSKKITEKLRSKGLAEDETVQFKSYLLSLGVDDPVTKEAATSSHEYFEKLAKEVAGILADPLKECGGLMTLPEVYCRVNRARGVHLISPEDLQNALKMLDRIHSPLSLHTFQTGVQVVQLRSGDLSSPETLAKTLELVQLNECLDKVALAQLLGIPIVLAMERLLAAETAGLLCRDETLEALRFYPNRFNETT
ncbi:Vacuolar protein-sorting-associated protein 36 [Aphelenchoides bicaudatus]|nr:Vacuolar protein-sorting-associated protein 36 [Aphelenchoides bicaudatus]